MIELTFIEDPAQVNNFYSDENENIYYLDDKKPIFCDKCNTQYKHREGWIYCINCEDSEDEM